MQNAKALYDVVIYDTPPVSVGADASLIAARTEAAILVVDANTSRRASVEWALEQLRRAHVNVLGVIVNRVSGAGVAPYYYQGAGVGSEAPAELTETPAASSRV